MVDGVVVGDEVVGVGPVEVAGVVGVVVVGVDLPWFSR